MKFIFGLILGTIIAVVYHGGWHERAWQQADLQWAAWNTQQSAPEQETVPEGPSVPKQLTVPAPVPTAAPQPEQDSVPVSSSAEPILTVRIPSPDIEADAANEQGFQNAWLPFHSEASATGFAEKLSQQLQHDFIAVKIGPGRYEVGFNYSSVQDRDATLDNIEVITGYRAESES